MIRIRAPQAQATLAALRAKAEALAADLGARYTVELSLPVGMADRLGWFNYGTSRQPPRPVLQLNAYALREVQERMRVRFVARTAESLNVQATLTVGANALREVWVNRLTTSGGDLTLAPLSASWALTKRRRGLDPRIGVATGQMLRAVTRAQVIVRRA